MFEKITMTRAIDKEMARLKEKERQQKRYEDKKRAELAALGMRTHAIINTRIDAKKYASGRNIEMNDNCANYLRANIKQFYKGAVNQHNLRKYVEIGYTVSCDEDMNLTGVTWEQMLFFSRNDESIKYMKQQFEKAGIHLFIREKTGRLVILACSDKNTLARMGSQFGFMGRA